MDFNVKFPFHSVYKMTDYGLSLYTQEYMQKYLDEEVAKKTEPTAEDEDKAKKKFPKTSKIDLEPEKNLGIVNYV
jgi:hypothetical protein